MFITQIQSSSAYIKPFEEEMKEWEDKLLSMQDILDAWLRCQESWLYLEPIFNSEDIMKQMPVEGRKFNKVLNRNNYYLKFLFYLFKFSQYTKHLFNPVFSLIFSSLVPS